MAMEKTMIRNIAVVSLSRGMIGEPDVQFEVEIGIRRLEEYGLHVKFMPHALKGLEYVKAHPEKRADLQRLWEKPGQILNDSLQWIATDSFFWTRGIQMCRSCWPTDAFPVLWLL